MEEDEDVVSTNTNLLIEPLVAQNSNFEFNISQNLVAVYNEVNSENVVMIDPLDPADHPLDNPLIVEPI
ncbi:hypothetical protein MA16_Dca012554 [Dendrobium catenatum]|uniref:Uncharacterized protein n=1 Tax=Dendrobium catenatum TaxID=906689 RepID=A0A2I0VKM2_9ASPA|nr:hypothetical protein MA16_Dca012554 [Dendrobium catenatum]